MRSLQAVAAAAPTDERISWRARGDIGGGVDQCSLGDSELPTCSLGIQNWGRWCRLRPYGGICILQVCWCTCFIFGRPFVKWFALSYRTVVCLSVLSCPVCDVGVLWPKSWMDQDETWHAGRPRPWPHSVFDGDPAACKEGAQQSARFRNYRCRLYLCPYNPRSMSVVAKPLNGSRWNLGWR